MIRRVNADAPTRPPLHPLLVSRRQLKQRAPEHASAASARVGESMNHSPPHGARNLLDPLQPAAIVSRRQKLGITSALERRAVTTFHYTYGPRCGRHTNKLAESLLSARPNQSAASRHVRHVETRCRRCRSDRAQVENTGTGATARTQAALLRQNVFAIVEDWVASDAVEAEALIRPWTLHPRPSLRPCPFTPRPARLSFLFQPVGGGPVRRSDKSLRHCAHCSASRVELRFLRHGRRPPNSNIVRPPASGHETT